MRAGMNEGIINLVADYHAIELDRILASKREIVSKTLDKVDTEIVPDIVRRSWERSRKINIGTDVKLPYVDLHTPYKCKDNIEQAMVQTAHNLFKNFAITERIHMLSMPYFLLVNSEGVVMYEFGHRQTVEHFHSIDLGVNSNLSFDKIGTTACSIAIEEGRLVQLRGAHCYLDIFSPYIITSMPINVKGKTLGTLNIFNASMHEEALTNTDRRVNHLKFAVLSIINAVISEYEHMSAELIKETIGLSNNLINTHGIITVDKSFNVAFICNYAKKLISFDENISLNYYIPAIEKKLYKLLHKPHVKISVTLRNKTNVQLIVNKLKCSTTNAMIGYTLYVFCSEGNDIRYSLSNMVGEHKSLKELKEQVESIAVTRRNVLILGESGTGKEMVAQAIHDTSGVVGPFVAINCASIPANLIESELFGYVGGAFTGASKSGRAGLIEHANNGTLFLDEIGDMPLALQPVLLRVLEERRVVRIGGKESIPVNVRIVAATNVDLHEKISNKEFREDLFYRLSVININVPPLRERGSDALLLAKHFIDNEQINCGKSISISSEVKDLFLNYTWPGNVRQLENVVISSIYALRNENIIKLKHLPRLGNEESVEKIDNGQLTDIMHKAIMEALKSNDWNYAKTARTLGISRTTLYKKLKEYDVKK